MPIKRYTLNHERCSLFVLSVELGKTSDVPPDLILLSNPSIYKVSYSALGVSSLSLESESLPLSLYNIWPTF